MNHAADLIAEQLTMLGPMSSAEKRVALVFGLVALVACTFLQAASAVQTVDYGWEDNGTIVGSYGNVVDESADAAAEFSRRRRPAPTRACTSAVATRSGWGDRAELDPPDACGRG